MRNYNDHSGDFRRTDFMQEWEHMYSSILEMQLPKAALLGVSYELLNAEGVIPDKLQAMTMFRSPVLDDLFNRLIERYGEELLRDGACEEFENFLTAKIRSHSLAEGLLSRDQQLRMVETEEALVENVISFYPSQNVSAQDADDFLKYLCTVSVIGTMFYYLSNYGVSTDSYGYNRVSYTLLEKDLSERLIEKTGVKAVPDLVYSDLGPGSTRIARLGLRGPVHVMDIIEDFILSVRNACSMISGEITLADILRRNIFMRDCLEAADMNPDKKTAIIEELKEAVSFLTHFIGDGMLGVFEVEQHRCHTGFSSMDSSAN